jgi:hydrogenase large subunit
VDVVSALKADPKKTSELAQSISHWPKSSPGYFSDLQKRLTAFVERCQSGILANGYWGHSAYKLPAEANLMAVAHYLVGGAPRSFNLDENNAINAERLAF